MYVYEGQTRFFTGWIVNTSNTLSRHQKYECLYFPELE